MHHHHEARVVAHALLHDALHAHLVVAQHLRDLRQDARLVRDLEVEVEGGLDFVARDEAQLLGLRDALRAVALDAAVEDQFAHAAHVVLLGEEAPVGGGELAHQLVGGRLTQLEAERMDPVAQRSAPLFVLLLADLRLEREVGVGGVE